MYIQSTLFYLTTHVAASLRLFHVTTGNTAVGGVAFCHISGSMHFNLMCCS